MVDIKKGDIVVYRAVPNPGEMIVQEVINKPRVKYLTATESNPIILVQYWDNNKQQFNYDSIFYNDLLLIRRD